MQHVNKFHAVLLQCSMYARLHLGFACVQHISSWHTLCSVSNVQCTHIVHTCSIFTVQNVITIMSKTVAATLLPLSQHKNIVLFLH